MQVSGNTKGMHGSRQKGRAVPIEEGKALAGAFSSAFVEVCAHCIHAPDPFPSTFVSRVRQVEWDRMCRLWLWAVGFGLETSGFGLRAVLVSVL